MAGVKLSGILYIYKARFGVRAALVQEGLSILGIAVGVALLFASQISTVSLTHSLAQVDAQLVGDAQLQLVARGSEGVNERILAKIRHVSGVLAAFPILEQRLNVIGPTGERPLELIGTDPSALGARYDVKPPVAQPPIVLPSSLGSEIGTASLQAVRLQLGARFIDTPVRVGPDQATTDNSTHGPVALAPISYVQRLAGARGRLSRIFVRYNPTLSLRAHAGLAEVAAKFHVNLLPANFDSRLFAVAVSPESQSETLFSAISALIGFIFALNAMLMAVPSRRALIHDVRQQGASRGDTVKIILFDALVIGVFACALGLGLGYLLAVAVFQTTPSYLSVAFPVGRTLIVTWQSLVLAVTAGTVAAIMGVFWPLWEIIARPLLPMRPSRLTRRRPWSAVRLAVGGVCLVLTTVTMMADTKAALIGNITLVVALVALLPAGFTTLVRLCEQISNKLGGIGSTLAVTELQAPQTRVRSLAITATVAVAVFGIVEFQGIQANLNAGLDTSSRDLDSAADVWIMPTGKTNVQATTPFESRNTAALRRLPGVARVNVFRGGFFNWGTRRLWVLAPSSGMERAVPASQVIGGNAALASGRVREGNWAVLSQALAMEHHLRVGQSFTLPAPQPVMLRVAALTTNLGWPPGALILSSATYARAWISDAPTAYTIQTASGVSPALVRDRVRQVLRSEPGLAVETARERTDRRYAIAAQGLSRLTEIRLLVLMTTILAVIGAMGAMIWQRRAWIAFIKVQGYDERTLVRWLLSEAGVLLSAGCLMGALFGVYAQLLGSRFLATVTGFPIAFGVEGLAAGKTFALANMIALAVVAVLAFFVVRVPANPEAAHTY